MGLSGAGTRFGRPSLWGRLGPIGRVTGGPSRLGPLHVGSFTLLSRWSIRSEVSVMNWNICATPSATRDQRRGRHLPLSSPVCVRLFVGRLRDPVLRVASLGAPHRVIQVVCGPVDGEVKAWAWARILRDRPDRTPRLTACMANVPVHVAPLEPILRFGLSCASLRCGTARSRRVHCGRLTSVGPLRRPGVAWSRAPFGCDVT